MNKVKKLFSLLLVASMMLSLVQISTFATDSSESSTARGKVNMVYLGTGTGTAASDNPSIQEVPDTSDWSAGTVFWVGITLSDLKKMDATASNDSDRTSHFSSYANEDVYDWAGDGGIFNIAIGIEYASKYIQPVYLNDTQMKNANFYPAIMKKLNPSFTNYTLDANNTAAAIAPELSGGEATGREACIISADDAPKLAYASMTSTGDITTNMFGFTDDLTDDQVIIMAFPFKVVEIPAPGTKVLQAALNPTNFIIQTGSSSQPYWGAQWNANRTITADKNLKNHLDYTGDLDLFPGGTTQTGIKVTSDATALTYKDMQDVHGITKVIKTLESGDGADITDYKYYYGPTNSKVGQSVDASLTGLTEIKTSETDTWQNGVPKTANGQCLYIVAGDYMWNVGVLSVSDASISKLASATLTPDWTTGQNVVDVNDIKFKAGSVTATYDNGKSKAIQYDDFATNGLGLYRTGSPYTEIPLTNSTVKFAAANSIVVAVKSTVGTASVIQSNALSYSGKAAAADTYTLSGNIALANASQNTYPDAKLDLSGLTIKVTNADTGKDTTLAITDSSVKFAIQGISGTMTAAELQALSLVPGTMSGKTLTVTVDGQTLGSNTKTIPTVNKKSVNLTATATGLTKVYDGNNNVTGTITYGVNAADLAAGDSAPAAGTISGLTAKYASTDVANNIAINITGTPVAAASQTDFNNKYTIGTTMPTGVTGNITAKALTNTTFTVTASQNPNQSGDYAVPETSFDPTTAMGKVGTDDVKIVMTNGKISEADIQAGGTGKAVTGASFALSGAKAGNYSLGTVTVTATVSNLPVANALDAATLAKIQNATMKASNANNTEAYLITGLANLPTEGQSNIAGNDGKVNIAWTVDGTFNEKGGVTYTYTGKVTPVDSTKIVSTISDLTVTVEVTAIEITEAPAVTVPASVQVGDTVTLPADAKITVDGTEYTVPITWSPSTVDTSEEGNITVTGTVDYSSVPSWATIADAAKTIEKTIAVSSAPLTAIASIKDMPAAITVKASDDKNQPDNKLDELLPTTLTVVDSEGNEHEVDVTWTTTDTYDVKGGEYTYTPNFSADGFDFTAVSGENAPTVTITVTPVTASIDSSIFSAKTITQGTTISSFADLGMIEQASVEVDGVTIEYTIAWDPSYSALDTSVAGTKNFTGTISFVNAPEWFTIPTDLTGTKTITVKAKSSGGGGGVAGYTVKFDAGSNGTITTGKASVSVLSGSKVAEDSVPTVTAKDGYKFVGWSNDGGETLVNVTADAIKKNVTFTAVYEEVVVPTEKPVSTPKPQIDTNYTKPYASGYDDGMFLPDDYITRAELASMIARLINGDDISNAFSASFPDVDNAWYNKYIGFLEDTNVISGYEDGTFRPNQTVTRGEMCAIIVRAQLYNLISVNDMFSDVTDEDWAKDYITTLASMNIVSGYEDGTFGTYSPITRAETVAIINRVLEPSTPIITFHPLDIAGHWAEADILLAVNERQIIGTEVEPTVAPEETPEAAPEVEEELEETVEPTAEPAE